MSLNDVLGDSAVCRQINSLIASKRLPHAIVLECENPDIRNSAAKEIIKAVMCSSGGMRPCGKCINCIKAEQEIHPDVYHVQILDKKQAVGVGEIRRMISECYIKPNEASGKVCLITDKMTAEAQNALLKILEEPPQNVQFIIAVQMSSSLLQTVLSRSVVFRLDENGSQVNDSQAHEIAAEIAAAIPKNMELPLMIATGKLVSDKQLTKRVLEILSEILSRALEEKYFPEKASPSYVADIERTLRKRSIVKLIEVVSKAQTMLSQNCNINLLVTWLCANIRRARHASL